MSAPKDRQELIIKIISSPLTRQIGISKSSAELILEFIETEAECEVVPKIATEEMVLMALHTDTGSPSDSVDAAIAAGPYRKPK